MSQRLSTTNKDLFVLHLTVIVWGFTGILGRLISIGAIQLVWYRVGIAGLTLLIYFFVSKRNLKVTKQQLIQYFLTGGIVATHWILFFYAIKVSTVSVALVALSAATLFTSILEPIFKKKHILIQDVIIGLIIISGIFMIFKFESQYTLGIAVGLLSAVASALFATINSMLVQKQDARVIGVYELCGAFIWVSVFRLFDGSIFTENFQLSGEDWLYLLVLGTICTALAYVAGVTVMRSLSAFRVALVTNLEPVYGILLAFAFFGSKEQMTAGFYAGTLLILSALFFYPLYKKRKGIAH